MIAWRPLTAACRARTRRDGGRSRIAMVACASRGVTAGGDASPGSVVRIARRCVTDTRPVAQRLVSAASRSNSAPPRRRVSWVPCCRPSRVGGRSARIARERGRVLRCSPRERAKAASTSRSPERTRRGVRGSAARTRRCDSGSTPTRSTTQPMRQCELRIWS